MLKQNRDPGKILIIGSGVGGLTAGIILAKLGHSVTIVEKNAGAGGLMRGYRRRGFDCPVGVHYLGSLASGQPLRRLWDYLGVTGNIPLERMGTAGPIDRYIFDDFHFDLPEGLPAFAENLMRAFPGESKQITAVTRQLREVSDSFARLDMLLSPEGVPVSVESFSSMGEHLVRLGCSERLKSVLGVPSTLIGLSLQECPLFYYYLVLSSYLLSSWRLRGDSLRMAEAFVGRFRKLGGQLVVADGVERILTEPGRITGGRLHSGREIDADTIIAAVHPQNITPMLPADVLRSDQAERIDRLENTKGLFVVTLAVDGSAHETLPYNLFRLHPEADGSLARGSFHQIREGSQPGTHLLTMMATSGIEEWHPWERTRSGQRGEDYEQEKRNRAGAFIAEATALFGPLKGKQIVDIYTPLTIRDWVGSPGGSAYGIRRSSSQLMKTAFLSRPALKGLFFAGQNILAPGIMGTTLGAFQVIRRIIGQERFSREVLEELR
ncbi:MAG TPA: NAD(P)/FAD-dependent oxidoreductase [Syntrophales bacterium]|jgi:phytoene dehydrogenase-like protein|nr:NAD(P)/FAD-dependent oxidoreductase [Syntrophales bacterium]